MLRYNSIAVGIGNYWSMTSAVNRCGSLYNFTRSVKTLRVEVANPRDQTRRQQRTPAMATGRDFPRLDHQGAFDHSTCSTAYEHLKGRPSVFELTIFRSRRLLL